VITNTSNNQRFLDCHLKYVFFSVVHHVESATVAMNRTLWCTWLGLKSYADALQIQTTASRHLLDSIQRSNPTKNHGYLLLVEHKPVYTIGIRTKGYSKEDEAKLKELGADFIRTNRGGLITFHGPGQLVAYPIIYMKWFNLGMRKYIAMLETTVIDTCAQFGLTAKTTSNTGVWIKDRKIAAIGLYHINQLVI